MWRIFDESFKKISEKVLGAVDVVGAKVDVVVGVVGEKTEKVIDVIGPTIAPAEMRKISELNRIAKETEHNTKALEEKLDIKNNLLAAAAEELAIAEQEKERNMLLIAQLMKLSVAGVVEKLPVSINSDEQRKLEEKQQQELIFNTLSTLDSLIEEEEFQQHKLDETAKSIKEKKTPLTKFFKQETQLSPTTSTESQLQVRT